MNVVPLLFLLNRNFYNFQVRVGPNRLILQVYIYILASQGRQLTSGARLVVSL